MIKTLPITEAREKLPTLVSDVKTRLDQFIITVNGKPSAVLLSVDEYESWKETNEILADKELMKAIKQGEKEIEEGKGIPWDEAKKELGWDV